MMAVVAEFRQAGLKGSGLGLSAPIVGKKATHQHSDAPFLLARLRARRERPCGCGSADKLDELPSSHAPLSSKRYQAYERYCLIFAKSSRGL